jgi:hypothetical protein
MTTKSVGSEILARNGNNGNQRSGHLTSKISELQSSSDTKQVNTALFKNFRYFQYLTAPTQDCLIIIYLQSLQSLIIFVYYVYAFVLSAGPSGLAV